MILLIDNNDGLGQQEYTAHVDAEHLPAISRSLNMASTMTLALLSADPSFHPPVSGARVVLQRSDGSSLFTGYLAGAPEQQYLGRGQTAAWRFVLQAIDDSFLLDHNPLPARTPFALRTAGDALKTLANDVLPGGLDESGVQDVSAVNQFAIVPQKTWSEHARELATTARASYRVADGKLSFAGTGAQSFTISEDDTNFDPHALTLLQPDLLRNDVTILGELEPATYVRDYFLGNGAALAFYLSEQPYGAAATLLQETYTTPRLSTTLWDISDPNHALSLSGGQLHVNGGPATITFAEQVELAGGLLMQHGKFVFGAASSGTVGGIYNGALGEANCVAGFKVSPNGGNSLIQALVNGSPTGPAITTIPGHQYALATQLICPESERVRRTYLSSLHPAGNGRGGAPVPAALRIVLSIHDVDPNNPGTLAAPATVLYDNVVAAGPGFGTYALLNISSFYASVAFTRVQRVIDAEVRSIIPGGQFRTRLNSALVDGGECSISSKGVLHFYAPYPPQPNEEVVVAYRTSARAMARVQDLNSIAQHANGGDLGKRSFVRRLKLPAAPTSIDCELAATAALDDSVQQAWQGEYKIASDFLPASDVNPGDAVQVAAPSRGANFSATVRKVEVQVISLGDDRSHYDIKFANDAAQPLAFEFEDVMLPAPLTTIYNTNAPSSSLYIDSLTAAQITNVIATEITVDAGTAPPPGGGIEVRRSDGGWGSGDGGNLAGRFTTQTFTLPRLSRAQAYYLRQYDASSPAKYSRYSMLLYVDYPL